MEANKDEQMTTKERYLNPFTDFGFKKIFGTEANKELLISFLNEVLPLPSPISTLQYKKTEHLGQTSLDRKVVYDLYCENEKGEKLIVELQKAQQTFFKDRALFYSTFPIQEQAQRGDWNYQLQSVYTVAILDFHFAESKGGEVKQLIKLMDVNSQKVFYDKLTFLFIQMPNFNKQEHELHTMEDKWLYLLKHLPGFSDRPNWMQEQVFDKVFQIAELAQFSPEERIAYEDSMKYYRDIKNSLDTARDKGKEEALQELMPLVTEARKREEEAKLREENERIQKLEAQSREESLRQNLFATAKALLSKGFSAEEVTDMTGLSLEEIKSINE